MRDLGAREEDVDEEPPVPQLKPLTFPRLEYDYTDDEVAVHGYEIVEHLVNGESRSVGVFPDATITAAMLLLRNSSLSTNDAMESALRTASASASTSLGAGRWGTKHSQPTRPSLCHVVIAIRQG